MASASRRGSRHLLACVVVMVPLFGCREDPEAAAAEDTPGTTEMLPAETAGTEGVGVDSTGSMTTEMSDHGRWVALGEGDCSGRDVGSHQAGYAPPDVDCLPDHYGKIAVCWDNQRWRHPNGRAWCTYKSVTVEECVGGGAPGRIWRCEDDGAT